MSSSKTLTKNTLNGRREKQLSPRSLFERLDLDVTYFT